MIIYGFHRTGFDGQPIAVEIDVRPGGLPGIDLVGLPDNAVKEAKERVRSGVRNAGYEIPRGRILLNLAPAGIRKEGAGFDLPIAMALVGAAMGWYSAVSDKWQRLENLKIMALGEIQLSGAVMGVRGVLSAAAASEEYGIDYLFVPAENREEALSLGGGKIIGIASISEGIECLVSLSNGIEPVPHTDDRRERDDCSIGKSHPDFADVKGQPFLKRGMEIAAAGGHHTLVFGVPGTGKTMSALRLAGILPELSREESVEVTKIHSIAGKLHRASRLIRTPPLRSPHHSSSLQGILGGGKVLLPGEISLAHNGVLVLDEAPEFPKYVLQNLREPMERGEVRIARAGISVCFPARFQLVMTANPCPCGNLGKKKAVCICSRDEIARYWRKIGGALLDRMDIRIPVSPDRARVLGGESGEPSSAIRERISASRDFRITRRGQTIKNADLSPSMIGDYVVLPQTCRALLADACETLDLSSRAVHSVQRVARTIADLAFSEEISVEHLKEAILYRRYGDSNMLWTKL